MTDAEPSFQVTLVTRAVETAFPCRASEFILQAARDKGLDLPSDCLQGYCVTCAGRILSGEVDQSASRLYFDEDAKEKFTLLCTARPHSDLRIETHQKTPMRLNRMAHKLPVSLDS